MAIDKTQSPKNDVFATQQELVLEALSFAARQREELEKIGRDGVERAGVLVRAGCQTVLDGYDFGVRLMSTYQNLTEEMVRTGMGMARKATARAA